MCTNDPTKIGLVFPNIADLDHFRGGPNLIDIKLASNLGQLVTLWLLVVGRNTKEYL